MTTPRPEKRPSLVRELLCVTCRQPLRDRNRHRCRMPALRLIGPTERQLLLPPPPTDNPHDGPIRGRLE